MYSLITFHMCKLFVNGLYSAFLVIRPLNTLLHHASHSPIQTHSYCKTGNRRKTWQQSGSKADINVYRYKVQLGYLNFLKLETCLSHILHSLQAQFMSVCSQSHTGKENHQLYWSFERSEPLTTPRGSPEHMARCKLDLLIWSCVRCAVIGSSCVLR